MGHSTIVERHGYRRCYVRIRRMKTAPGVARRVTCDLPRVGGCRRSVVDRDRDMNDCLVFGTLSEGAYCSPDWLRRSMRTAMVTSETTEMLRLPPLVVVQSSGKNDTTADV